MLTDRDLNRSASPPYITWLLVDNKGLLSLTNAA